MNLPAANAKLKSDADFEASHPLRPLVLAGAMTLLAYAGGVVAVTFVTRDYVPESQQSWWVIASTVFVFIWFGLVFTMWMRKPNAQEAVRIWGWASLFITFTSHVVVVWAIWGFFPLLPDAQRMALSGMFLICSPTQLIAAPENVHANRLGILASLGSLVVWLVLEGSPVSRGMAGFAAGIGIMLFVLCSYVPSTVAQTVEARLAAELAKRQLEVALAAVAQERDAKTRFMAAASHDLGQPLQAASLYFDQTLMARDPSQRTNAIEGVRKAFEATEQLLAHMLNHLRLDADAVEPQFSKIKLPALFQSLAKQFKPLADKTGIDIRVFAGAFDVYSDKVLLERALGNLINNAIHHSQGTRVLLVARPLPQSGLRLWVLDDGNGVKADDVPLIFSDYYRGSQAGGLGVVGFGLGLSSVKRIAHLLGGEAGLEPRWKTGAAFYIDLAQGAVLGSHTTSQQRKPS